MTQTTNPQATSQSPASFVDIMHDHASAQGSVTAFTFGDEHITYAEIDEGSNRVANALIELGVAKGERVSFLGKNHHLYFEALLGAAKIGAVMTPVNWRLAAPEVAYILENAGSRVVFIGDGFAEMLAKATKEASEVGHVVGIDATDHDGTDYRSWRDAAPADRPDIAITSEDDALQLYTSGTTGRPKGAVMTHGSLLQSLDPDVHGDNVRDWQKRSDGDVALLAMPCFHISGSGNGLASMIAGSTSIVLSEYDPTQALELIEAYPISKLFLVPAAIQILLNHPRVKEVDFSDLTHITYGASPIPLELMREAMDVIGCGFIQMYGMTETSGTIVALDPEDHVPEGSPKMRSVGRPLNGVEIKIIDAAGSLVPTGEVGEIATRSARNMSRYWNLPEATAETIDKDGWLRTGDAGYLDEDGYLYIHDRVKDMIISGGENVYPAEVENALYSHEAVADVAVIGVPDEKWGEAVKACVVMKPGQALSEAELISHTREHIAGYKCPKSVDFIDELPRNPSGKILRRELRAPYWEGKERAVN